MTGHGKVYEKIQTKKPQTQPFHPWSCYRDENGDIVLMYEGIHQSFYLRGITKEQVSSLREELKAFEFLDMELNQSLMTEKELHKQAEEENFEEQERALRKHQDHCTNEDCDCKNY